MRICIVHNQYEKASGEETAVFSLMDLLRGHGQEVVSFMRGSAEIGGMPFGKARAFLSGIYSFKSRRAMKRLLRDEKPDLVHIHNLYPLISPSVLPVCRDAGVPVVMTLHNYRLVCPTGLLLSRGEICHKCLGGREYWCVLKNCERSVCKSVGYALRNAAARTLRLYYDNVSIFMALSENQRQLLVREGVPASRTVVVPNHVPVPEVVDHGPGGYVGYAGRISPEKNIPLLVQAAEALPKVPFKIAGDCRQMPEWSKSVPPNFQFLGYLGGGQLDRFYESSRMIVQCSRCYETFGLVIVEAMLRGKPVVCARIGAWPELVEEGEGGLLFEPGNAEEMTEKIRYLWQRPELCRRMGRAARARALKFYSSEAVYLQLSAVYERALAMSAASNRKEVAAPAMVER